MCMYGSVHIEDMLCMGLRQRRGAVAPTCRHKVYRVVASKSMSSLSANLLSAAPVNFVDGLP